MKIAVYDYGAGNVHSACHALSRLGADVELTSEADRVLGADGVLVPGVGAFGYVMDRFVASGGPSLVRERLARSQPVFGICVGMQILFETAEEKGTYNGLGLLSGSVTELGAPRLPHMGWSSVEVPSGSALFAGVEDQRFYFVHSYARAASPHVANLVSGQPVIETTCTYGESFVAAVESGPLWATQFHPEKSGSAGLLLLRNWLNSVAQKELS